MFGESQPLDTNSILGRDEPFAQDPISFALDEEGEEEEDKEEVIQDWSQGNSSQKKAKSPTFLQDLERVLEFKLLEAYIKVLSYNKYRASSLRRQERDYLVSVVLTTARRIYPEDAETLTLYQGQYKTKEDQYQRRIQALERLLFKYSRFSINQVTGLVTADNRY